MEDSTAAPHQEAAACFDRALSALSRLPDSRERATKVFGEMGPGPSDWEATVRTTVKQHLRPGTYELRAETPDSLTLTGHALLRFSDGHQHLFRGDGPLGGAEAALA